MTPDNLIELMKKQGAYSHKDNKLLQETLVSNAVLLRAMRRVLGNAQTIQYQISTTLPTPELTHKLSQQIGLWQGIYFAFEELARLTELKEEPDNVA